MSAQQAQPENYGTDIKIRWFKKLDADSRSLRLNPSSEEGETLSRRLFEIMVEHLCNIKKNHIGAKRIILDAVPKAIHFYERRGFRRFAEEMVPQKWKYVDGCKAMYFDM